MQNVIRKIMKFPEERPVNKIVSIHGKVIQNEGIKNDALNELKKNDDFYAGTLRINYELIAENTRLRKKCNKVISAYNKLSKKNKKTEDRLQKYVNWRKKRNAKLLAWYIKRKNAKLKKMKITVKKKGKTNEK